MLDDTRQLHEDFDTTTRDLRRLSLAMAVAGHDPLRGCATAGHRVSLLEQSYSPELLHGIELLQAQWARAIETPMPYLRDVTLFDIILCTREAVLNAMLYGCQRGGLAEVSISYCTNCRRIMVRVSDPGPGHSFQPNRDAEESHRGLFIIDHLAESVRTERNGATVEMHFDASTRFSRSENPEEVGQTTNVI